MKTLLLLLSVVWLVGCDNVQRRSICGQVIEIGMCTDYCAVKIEWQTGMVEIAEVYAPVMENMVVYKRIVTTNGKLYNTRVSKQYHKRFHLTTDCPYTNVVAE